MSFNPPLLVAAIAMLSTTLLEDKTLALPPAPHQESNMFAKPQALPQMDISQPWNLEFQN